MFKKFSLAAAALAISYACFAFVGEKQESPVVAAKAKAPTATVAETASFDEKLLKEKIFATLGLQVKHASPTPMPGVAEVVTNQGLFYSSYDGGYLIQGKLWQLGANVTDLTEQSLAKVRVDGVNEFEGDMIVYPAKNEKHVVTVFTDITCGYCRKMHEQMDEYNENGITIRYLAYPRAGIKDRLGNLTQGFKDLRSVWCHEDPNTALTKAKAGSGVAQRICDKPIEEEFNFGRQVGVSGTPAIITSSGFMLPGYREPDALLQILESL